jgi:hypothetical protein
MPEDNGQHVYTPQALEACEKALRTILTKIGPWEPEFSLSEE